MAPNIKDAETDSLIRQLAELTGESITEAVRKAVLDRLEQKRRRHGKRPFQVDLARDAYLRFGKGFHDAGEALLFKGDDFARTDVTPRL